jgi:CO/xanthine dehydrogenase Mo-binding subunit
VHHLGRQHRQIEITTIEAIGAMPADARTQKAWLDREVVQCEYCQSGQIMSASALLASNPRPTDLKSTTQCPAISTAYWRSVGPSHNVFVTESFMDELTGAAKQDAVAYRLALLDKTPRAKAVLELAAKIARWGQPLPKRAVQFVFGTYMAQVAEVEVSKNGEVRVRRLVCAVDCGTVVNPDTVRAQIEGADHLRHHGCALWRDHA